ncbi:MAG: ABC transporter ATP-binding protein [Firmicutes bacterium]|nr:ABC transporter ATP-binding protein [Bacillota bacterium]
MVTVRLVGISKGWSGVKAVDNLSLDIGNGDFVTLLGPSGCGKTTTLRMIAGLEDPDDGEIYIHGKLVFSASKGVNVPPAQRGLGMIFQSYALWPHMTVFDNVAFGLVQQKLSKDQINQRVTRVLADVELEGLAHRYPSELSGGQQQRVAVARMIVVSPELLLMDEPLSNLDTRLRMQMRASLKRMHQETNTTVVYVTHDQEEALTMSTGIAVMNKGKLEQYASPEEVYERPASKFVAEFTGNPQTNFIDAEVVDGRLKIGDRFIGHIDGDALPNAVTLSFRPEAMSIRQESTPNTLPATVYATLLVGASVLVYVHIGNIEAVIRAERGSKFRGNQEIWLEPDWTQVNVYSPTTGRRLDYAVRG